MEMIMTILVGRPHWKRPKLSTEGSMGETRIRIRTHSTTVHDAIKINQYFVFFQWPRRPLMKTRYQWHWCFFCKTIYSISKKQDTNTKTNHYILLTNVNIKRCIKPGSDIILRGWGWGGEFQPDNYLTDISMWYSSHKRQE